MAISMQRKHLSVWQCKRINDQAVNAMTTNDQMHEVIACGTGKYLMLKRHGWPRQQNHGGTWEWKCLKEKRSWTVSAETHSDSCNDGLSL